MSMPNEADRKARAVEAFRILNEFIGDLISSTANLKLLDTPLFSQADIEVQRTFFRMCISYLVITLSKWGEFYDCYLQVIPKDLQGSCKKLKKSIENRGITYFRNKIVGHIWDDKLKRPLTMLEVHRSLLKIYGDDPEKFIQWVNNSQSNIYPDTVVGIVEHVRDRIREEFNLSESDIVHKALLAELGRFK